MNLSKLSLPHYTKHLKDCGAFGGIPPYDIYGSYAVWRSDITLDGIRQLWGGKYARQVRRVMIESNLSAYDAHNKIKQEHFEQSRKESQKYVDDQLSSIMGMAS
jgi:hypothetical protein